MWMSLAPDMVSGQVIVGMDRVDGAAGTVELDVS
jgi:hypothetical protein